MKALIVRKTASSLTSSALATYRQYVAKEALAANVVYYYGGSAQEPPQYKYANGSMIAIGGMDKATRIMSTEYDLIYVQEAIEVSTVDWESLTTRLRNGAVSFQQLMADTNPDTATHWLKQRCDAGQTKLIDTKHEDNPTLFNDDGSLTVIGKAYISKLDNLTGVRKHRLRSGLWVSAEGVIYEDWDSEVHVIEPFEIPLDWTRWWTVDFGYKHPFVLQCWAEDPDGRLYLYREIFHSGRLVEDHARQIMSIVKDKDGKWLEPEPTAVICDHDAEGRATLEKYLERGTVPAIKLFSSELRYKATENLDYMSSGVQ
jgi:phage terminase large subunit